LIATEDEEPHHPVEVFRPSRSNGNFSGTKSVKRDGSGFSAVHWGPQYSGMVRAFQKGYIGGFVAKKQF
jgi:hypothetical protein